MDEFDNGMGQVPRVIRRPWDGGVVENESPMWTPDALISVTPPIRYSTPRAIGQRRRIIHHGTEILRITANRWSVLLDEDFDNTVIQFHMCLGNGSPFVLFWKVDPQIMHPVTLDRGVWTVGEDDLLETSISRPDRIWCKERPSRSILGRGASWCRSG